MTLPVEERIVIQGHVVASKEELWVATSLTRFGWTFDYQVPFFGGWMIAGGFVVDFVVHTVPLLTPLWINGEYWHKGAQAERDRVNQALLVSRIRGYFPALELWGEQLTDENETEKSVLKMFGRNN